MVLALGMISDRARRACSWCSRRRTAPPTPARSGSSAGRSPSRAGAGGHGGDPDLGVRQPAEPHAQPALLPGGGRRVSRLPRRLRALRPAPLSRDHGERRRVHGRSSSAMMWILQLFPGPGPGWRRSTSPSPTWCRRSFPFCWWSPRSRSICCSGASAAGTTGCCRRAWTSRSSRCCSRCSGSSGSSCSRPPRATSSSRPTSGPTWSGPGAGSTGSGSVPEDAARQSRRRRAGPRPGLRGAHRHGVGPDRALVGQRDVAGDAMRSAAARALGSRDSWRSARRTWAARTSGTREPRDPTTSWCTSACPGVVPGIADINVQVVDATPDQVTAMVNLFDATAGTPPPDVARRSARRLVSPPASGSWRRARTASRSPSRERRGPGRPSSPWPPCPTGGSRSTARSASARRARPVPLRRHRDHHRRGGARGRAAARRDPQPPARLARARRDGGSGLIVGLVLLGGWTWWDGEDRGFASGCIGRSPPRPRSWGRARIGRSGSRSWTPGGS